jgi:hypothetical protein
MGWAELVNAHGSEWPVAPDPTGGFRCRRARACYRNAANIAMDHGLRYCEGWAYDGSGVGVQHAWNLTDDGLVVDTTWREPGTRYFGVAVDTTALCAVILKQDTFGPVLETVLR